MTSAAARLDLYGPIHKALRRFMNDTLQRLGTLDVNDAADVTVTLAQLGALLTMLRSHLKHENDFVHTAIEARQPAGARTTADDHLEHLAAIGELETQCRALRDAPPAQRDTRAARLYREFALFVAENVRHMHYEETINNGLLWAHYSDAELLALHERLLASVPPGELMDTLRWLVPSVNPQELAGLLGGMQAKAPPEAFANVLAMVRELIDAPRWAKLAAALGASGRPLAA